MTAPTQSAPVAYLHADRGPILPEAVQLPAGEPQLPAGVFY